MKQRRIVVTPRPRRKIVMCDRALKMPPEPVVCPCPFCHKVNWRVSMEPDAMLAWVECVSCLATGPAVQGPLKTLDTPRVAAIKAWNERGAAPEEAIA